MIAGYGNDASRVDGWRGNRVRQLPDGSWWSDLNPAAQRLARQHVLASGDAAAAWDRLAEIHSSLGGLPSPIHVWVAGREGTVCKWAGPGGIDEMAARLPAAAVREFPGSGHSIHNSDPDAFITALIAVIDTAAKRTCLTADPASARGG
jgi:pimeloyl-ACP methyl ester carboxylesterase